MNALSNAIATTKAKIISVCQDSKGRKVTRVGVETFDGSPEEKDLREFKFLRTTIVDASDISNRRFWSAYKKIE